MAGGGWRTSYRNAAQLHTHFFSFNEAPCRGAEPGWSYSREDQAKKEEAGSQRSATSGERGRGTHGFSKFIQGGMSVGAQTNSATYLS